ncbi:NarK family nitrate/nitrite MFS transporter [Acinetobacter gerneri]|jgi:NNP family nitrate/nitrite transporter-like MFS transporter|uniref:Nitrate/nitrite transporter n=1 Tax=Acinetobacter gerneri TaxID=202952 RepID=A0AAW8JGR1_9GAMM|nr:NarK family nitrate/nitrite MFS transporter [Acinetobacter gerneri]MCH4242637.1 NarK family nitrate/nitrite MFS transporter [Acinetobacter gerneri]MDQ9009583.1 NarK family nitrate/nitrite MFS transporter [Acinetobacter gerneri]MDQ9013821.1 NarK family nitrate/nitrite MFS transporter [Acinetobacter gerneri]MDQ9024989.1 NarK family nitrate/nitrite MFS transporter [Acinetobacter gerneri]MDQ9052251.1 NarK family nitrate/nitrite MFS transporter [Acinetobacter gerneri]
MAKNISEWHPEDRQFWNDTGRAIAKRNLWISVPALLLAFTIWQVWSVTVVKLPMIGFEFTKNQLFWLAALPALSGATLRIFYSFIVPIFGGRRWTAISTASLLIPAFGLGFAVQNPQTSYVTMVILALLCGFGGANFSSSMANISFFFPRAEKGNALGINAGLGNLGVSVVQFVVPIVITFALFGALGGQPQTITNANGTTSQIWLQNAGFVWVPFIIISTVLAWFGMNNLDSAKASFKDQAVIFKRKHNWLMCWLYIGTFGSFIGFSAGFALLTKQVFPEIDPTKYAFLGPLVGALMRVVGGWFSDRFSAAKVTEISFIFMVVAVFGIMYFLPHDGSAGSFWGFFSCFMILFAFTGVGNASTFAQAPRIFSTIHRRHATENGLSKEQADENATKESAAIVGFMGAIGAYGGFFIPKSFGTSIALTGNAEAALICFILFYLTCIFINWWFYTRKNAEVRC